MIARMISIADLKYLDEVLQDVSTELAEPEVADLITLALDRKIEKALALLEGHIANDEG